MTSRPAAKHGALVLVAALLAGCGAEAPPQSSDASPTSTTGHSPAASVMPGSGGSAAPGESLARPGTPYSPAEVLAAMRDSRRPGGVPDELETDAVASAVAAELWTWDGDPWLSWSAGGACGPQMCSLDVAGSPASAAGTDLYTFVIDAGSGAVTLASTDLHGHPTRLEARLHAIARRELEAADLDGLSLVGTRWLPPPDTDRYWLAYRSGGEEGAPRLDVLVDLASGEVLEIDGS